MTSSNENRFRKLTALSMLFAALALSGCGPINIGSDECVVNSCSGLAKPEAVRCADGTSAGPTGACVKSADGACAWEVKSCSAVCTPGATKIADDGCNTCSCSASGTWACTDKACGTTCPSGATKIADDGCNTCTCSPSGAWGCTEMDCGNTCLNKGVRYAEGAHFSSAEGCCTCSSGVVQCTNERMACERSCTIGSETYQSGSKVPSGDCNTCWCTDGQVACTLIMCDDPTVCTKTDCGPEPGMPAYSCLDGSIGGFTGQCLRDPTGVCSWEIRNCPISCTPGERRLAPDGCNYCTCGADGSSLSCTDMACLECSYNGTVYRSGESFPATDGCNTCTCSNSAVGCTKMACTGDPICLAGDPGFLDGRCEACSVGADQTCNDDLLLSSIKGKCVGNYCVCTDGYAPNPQNGKCKKVELSPASVCTPGADQTCNGDINLSTTLGRCLFDGTCACNAGSVLDPASSKCVRSTN